MRDPNYAPQIPQHLQDGLYNARFERDACGIGFIARADGKAHPDVLPMALQALANLSHRGGVMADGKTSDGAGILCQLPEPFFQLELEKAGLTPPPAGNLAVGQFFLPKDKATLFKATKLVEKVLARPALKLKLLTWREVPQNPRILGPQAEATQPNIKQALIAPAAPLSQEQFERKLYLARRMIEQQARKEALSDLYICSFSSRVIVYKGLLIGDDLGKFYTDLLNHHFQVGLATFHQRYSTNTLPTWPRAQPFRLLAHNGEINTIDGNVNWMRAREAKLESPVWGDDIAYLKPVVDDSGSDSARLDNVLELLTLSGRDISQAIAMLAPEAWEMYPNTDEYALRRAFYRYHTSLMEPWDGPAALVFCDGSTVGITLDRNGLRPIRFQQTSTGFILAGSEAGFIEIDQAVITKKGRLGPGQMLAVETASQSIYYDDDIKNKLAAKQPYHKWIEEIITPLPTRLIPGADRGNRPSSYRLETLQAAFGYTAEEMTVILRPMAQLGAEPIGSMGDDTPIAYHSNVGKPLHHYLKQRFAQVTNPPIDPLREKSGMSLSILLGRRVNILLDGPNRPKQIQLKSPVLQGDELKSISDISKNEPDFNTIKLFATLPLQSNDKNSTVPNLVSGLKLLAETAEQAVSKDVDRATIIIISDKDSLDSDAMPMPMLLAVGAVHHHLIQKGLRSQVSLVVETGAVKDVHDLAVLIGFGAEAVNPYLALASVAELAKSNKLKNISPLQAMENYTHALEKGLLKIMSKIGISTIDSYCGAQIFEAIGLSQGVIDLCLVGTPSSLGGLSFNDIFQMAKAQHKAAFGRSGERVNSLPSPGQFKFKRGGEYHNLNPTIVKTLQKSVRKNDYTAYKEFSKLAHDDVVSSPVHGLKIKSNRQPIPLEAVESVYEIIRRFSTAAISHGAISSEAHETLAVAMNRLGGMSNSGEGGEAPDRFGTERNSAIKQIASGRFGVTPTYLMSARELQIKMAQGSKPGEGGHLPGHKVSVEIATLRHSTPGVGLISPPPHHDIYSIEDLAQLIFDLKQINPQAAISVKLVAESGVGTVAAGVVKGGADVVHISGASGGTGASPLSSIKHAGLPFELGLAEAQQTLIANDLRDRVRLRTDGGLKTGRDVVFAALLGADEYSFGTAALIAQGCLMARVCHSNTCPVGIATQKPELRAKFKGKPEEVMAYITFIAEEVREMLAEMGYRRLQDIIGRTDLLTENGKSALNLQPLLASAKGSNLLPHRNMLIDNDIAQVSALNWHLLELARPALNDGQTVTECLPIRNTDRSVGATLSGAIAAKHGAQGLPQGAINLTFTGSAGQSFGAFSSPGMHLTVIGEANDYLGKGMGGGEIILKTPPELTLLSQENVILGNTALYGATGGWLFAAGIAGERFAVRNSGAIAVVEGVGHHACEYMTGGVVAILGQFGFNFGAGMSGGLAFVYDPNDELAYKLNPDMVIAGPVENDDDLHTLHQLIQLQAQKTESAYARNLLQNWETVQASFKKVQPKDNPQSKRLTLNLQPEKVESVIEAR